MNSAKRLYFGMLGLAGLLSLGIVASLVICLSIIGRHANTLTEARLENRVLDERQASLIAAQKEIDEYSELNKIARAVVPQDKDQAESVRTISRIADEVGISLSGISFPPSNLGQSKKAGETQVTPVKGLTKVYEQQITVQSNTAQPITYAKFLEFLEKLESNRRTAQVANITILPSATDRTLLTFNIILSTYIKP